MGIVLPKSAYKKGSEVLKIDQFYDLCSRKSGAGN
jgi:hypothetical protein